MSIKEEAEKVLVKYFDDNWGLENKRFYWEKEEEQLFDKLHSLILAEMEKMVGKEKIVNEANKSPKPDTLNDCEVRREGFNQCRSETLANIRK